MSDNELESAIGATPTCTAWSRSEMAAQLADDIPEGWSVNLGIGIPTLVAGYIPPDREVIVHSENGLLGVGAAPEPQQFDSWLINAGKQPVTLRPGAAIFHQADSFAIIRGGHLDLCVLGAFEVSERGDIANWSRSQRDTAPAVGGAMDLAVGAKRLWVMMEHRTREGSPRILRSCRLPVTAQAVVSRVYTDLATFDVTEAGLRVVRMARRLGMNELQSVTDATIIY